MRQLDIAQLWEICIHFLWDQTLTESLDQLLHQAGSKTILDCAGGTGFPCLDLRRKGWDITYSDGSQAMFACFQKKLDQAGLQMPCFLADWRRLTSVVPRHFDAVFCRGNSLPYVDSWDRPLAELAMEHIQRALEEFYQMLNPGGLLYIDTAGNQEFNQTAYPASWDLGEKKIDGHTIGLQWSTDLDYSRMIRTWSVEVVVDGQHFQFSHQGYLLTPDELQQRLGRVGFHDVRPTEIPGENWYEVILCRKPA